MNSVRRIRVLCKLFRYFDKSSLSTYSFVQKSLGTQRNNTFQERLLNFLEPPNDTVKYEKATLIDKQKLQFPNSAFGISVQNDFVPETMKNAVPEYETLINSIKTLLQPQKSSTKIPLSVIDDNCCNILRKLSQSQILELLHLLTITRPQHIASLKFYKHSLAALRKLLENRSLSTRESLQLLLFESLRKKLAVRSAKFVINLLPPISDLSLMEQCIIAHSAFKCRVKLKDRKLLQDVIETNAESLVKDPAILVTFSKALRYTGPLSDCSLENLSRAIVNHGERFTLKFAAHTLSLYAEAKLECREVMQRLFDDSMANLSEERARRQSLGEPAEKDVDRLLWASGILNYKLRSSDTLEIASFINRRYKELSKKPFLIANTLLCLWILNCRLKKVLERCLEDKVFQPIIEEQKLWKCVARLQLLLSCVRIESPEIEIPDEIVRPYKVGMKIHRAVRTLRRIIENVAEELAIDEIVIDCPVEAIYIPGVSFSLKREKSFHVDLLDETTCLKGNAVPHGLTNLKLRLLSQVGIHSILITEAQLNDREVVSSIIARCIKDIV